MEFKAIKENEANAVITATVSSDTVKANVDKIAKQAAKTMDIQGFRKGKVPVSVVKQRYGTKLTQDAESEAIRDILDSALKELEIEASRLVGEPAITKFDKKENGDIDIEIKVSYRPEIDLGDYKALLPEIPEVEITDDEIDKRVNPNRLFLKWVRKLK